MFRDRRLRMIDRYSEELASLVGQIREMQATLEVGRDYETTKKALTDAEIELSKVREDHSREMREVEHKLGLHRTQVESERSIMKKEAEAERLRSVEEAKLAVREENLSAERDRFQQEIEFRTKRFEEEAATLRDLTGQILERLPRFDRTHTTHEYIGDAPAQVRIEQAALPAAKTTRKKA